MHITRVRQVFVHMKSRCNSFADALFHVKGIVRALFFLVIPLALVGCVSIGEGKKQLPVMIDGKPVFEKTLFGEKQKMYTVSRWKHAVYGTKGCGVAYGEDFKVDIKDMGDNVKDVVNSLAEGAGKAIAGSDLV